MKAFLFLRRGFLLPVFLLSTGLRGAPDISRETLLLRDIFLPGYGSFHYGSYGSAGWIAAGRLGTLALAYRFWKERQEFRSLSRAARGGDFYYGPGYRYKNPYGPGFYSSEEYQHEADRRSLYMGLSLTLHAAITTVSVLSSLEKYESESEKARPVFDLGIGPAGELYLGFTLSECGFCDSPP